MIDDPGITGLGEQPGASRVTPLKYDRKKMRLDVSGFEVVDGKATFPNIDTASEFRAAIDLKNVCTCWYIWVTGDMPRIRDITPLGKAAGPRPPDHKSGDRVFYWRRAVGVFLTFLSDQEVVQSLGRVELLSPERTLWRAMHELVKSYQSHSPDYEDKVPVVIITGLKKGVDGAEFVFEIEDWVERPAALPDTPFFHHDPDEEPDETGGGDVGTTAGNTAGDTAAKKTAAGNGLDGAADYTPPKKPLSDDMDGDSVPF